MGPQRFEVESEAWYRAIAEGRLAPVSDQCAGRIPPPEEPAQRGSAGDWGAGYPGYALGTSRSAAVGKSWWSGCAPSPSTMPPRLDDERA